MKKFRLKVWGEYACFTRPEMKVERVSYDIITPSASRAIFEAILWKPEISWHINKIEILNPFRWINLRRNEVKFKFSNHKMGDYIEENRVQRAGTFLCNVAYIIHAHIEIKKEAEKENHPKKYEEIFERRASQGQCIMQPYLGCREFAAYFQLLKEDELTYPLKNINQDLGWMLYDLDYSKDAITPKFFKAKIEEGVINIPTKNSEEIRG